MFGTSRIDENQKASWYWTSEPQTSTAHGRSWSVLEDVLFFIPNLIELILSLIFGSSGPQEIEMKQIQPTKDETFVKERTEEFRLWQAEWKDMQDNQWQIAPWFLTKISYAIKDTESWISQVTEENIRVTEKKIRNPQILRDLKKELKSIKTLTEGTITEANSSLWDPGFAQSKAPMDFLNIL